MLRVLLVFELLRVFFLVTGVANLVVGVTRFRNPAWRTTGWWNDHKLLGLMISGPPFLGPRRLRDDPYQPSSERFSGAIQIIVGVAFLVGSVVAVFVGMP